MGTPFFSRLLAGEALDVGMLILGLCKDRDHEMMCQADSCSVYF
jgi:hypothetical protein